LPDARRGFGRDLVPGALCYALTLCSFVVATKLTTAAAAIFLQSTAPIWVLVLAPLLIGEPARARDLPYVAAAALGLALVFLGSRDGAATAADPLLGNACALASGFFYALLLVFLRRTARGGGPDRTLPATVLGNLLAFALCAPFAFPVVEAPSARDLASVVYLGVIQIALAYWLFSRALSAIPTLEASLLVLIEPVLNPVWTWLLVGERPSSLAAAGGAVMVLALGAKGYFGARGMNGTSRPLS
jgi:drug/metabolite transporter (DMT)-like permease